MLRKHLSLRTCRRSSKKGGEAQRVDGDAAVVSAGEDSWSVSFNGESVERAGRDVKVRVCGGEGEDEETNVDDILH